MKFLLLTLTNLLLTPVVCFQMKIKVMIHAYLVSMFIVLTSLVFVNTIVLIFLLFTDQALLDILKTGEFLINLFDPVSSTIYVSHLLT